MKSLLGGILIISSLQTANAISTDTIKGISEKVVELHITHKPDPALDSAVRRRGIVDLGHSVCSGAFVTNNGYILTARHCATDVEAMEAETSDGRDYNAAVVAISAQHDLALVHIDRLNTPFFELAPGYRQGQAIYAYGSPLGIRDTLATGIIARIAGDLLYIDCSVLPGNSGGPLFDDQGRLVGITTAGFIVLYGMTHLNIAQSLDAIVFFARSLR